jgi:hypothetical protein
VRVVCETSEIECPEERFTLGTPFDDERLVVLGLGVNDDGFQISFHSGVMERVGELPESVRLFLDGALVAETKCQLTDTIPLAPDRFMDPLEILPASASHELRDIRTNRLRGPMFAIFGFSLLAIGGLLVAAAIQTAGFKVSLGFIGGSIAIALSLTSFGMMCIPYDQVHIDLFQRRVGQIRARFIFFRFREVTGLFRALDEFDHLRIIHRATRDSDGDVYDVFAVSLEGQIAYSSRDETVHHRSDSVQIRGFSSREVARRYAAQVALACGMKVLDTCDTGM